ncbi:efflux RND transporter permease subunit [Rhodoblastus acidophilus]|uniref:Efflux RND transporter permease subunit n=1 Tax=Candidatus Rhodoblastus alkanivorans TaxID=2954117 RepID=A0ABS9Z384_9HYPH|nr:efflux RND transporter permease subunit [Candidatus Rhodoblastus alkanivorans]MCI4677400.1 efflux RND transporter permease subunit [Candidatus Rhodoblastus alkanivorans]MCI4682135.1 efflux RND transporter permease subunit [Candidatus Rhodoblastus alkanivorans]MDI4639437.1 efflux RND transporter permease subunit [Rhodoblastus acidophilus]
MARVTGPQAAVIRFALRFRGVVIGLAALFVAYGFYALGHATYDVFPEFAPPEVSIQTEAPGLSPQQVESLVTRPIEAAVEGAAGQKRLVSNSIQGLSVITVFFDPETDIHLDRQLVAERLTQVAGQLPNGVKAPVMTPLTTSTEFAVVAGLTSSRQTLMRLTSIAKWTITPALTAVPGVADVEIFGGQTRSTQILVHPDKLIRFGLGMDDVLAAARQAAGVRGAGFLGTPNQRILIQPEGQSITPDELANVVLARHAGVSVTIGDVADVVAAPEPSIGGGAVMGEPAVVMNVTEQYGANTLEVTRNLDKAFAALRPALAREGVTLHDRLFRPADFIATATANLRSALLIGAVLVVIVLFLFLYDLRTAAICCTAIPLSLLAAVAVLQRAGITLNTITLGGLAIALGEVVDDAVVVVENVTRRLRDNGRRADPLPAARVVLEATLEVRSAVIYATFAVILVFLPVATISGVGGRMFGPLATTYIAAVLASLIVAISVTPALALVLLRHHTQEREPPAMVWSRRVYESILRRVARAPLLAVGVSVAATLAGLSLLPLFGATFLPELHEGHFVVHMTATPGTSLGESMRMGARVTAALEKLPIVGVISQRAGRAELTADTHGVHQSEFEVVLRKTTGAGAETAKPEILKALSDFPGVAISVNTFLTERIDETFSGYAAPFAVNVFGEDLDAIDATARKVFDILRQVPGAASVEIQSPPGLPQLAIKLRRASLTRWGVDPMTVLDTVSAASQGVVAGQTYEGDRVYNLIVKLAPSRQDGVAALGGLPVRARDGAYIPLRLVADIEPTSGYYRIQHQGGRRLQTVTADVEGRALSAFVDEAKARLDAAVKPPKGVYIEFSGAAEGQAQARRDLAVKALFAALGIVILLSIVTRNWRNLLLVLVNLPFALVGGLFAAFLSGGVLSLGSLVGFVTLCGITLRNSMIMISHFAHLVEVEGRRWGPETAIAGASDRLSPILITSFVTGLGLLPLAVGMNAPGREIEGPMAMVILGGLITSMALNLLVLPALAQLYGRFEPKTAEEELEESEAASF